MSQKLPVPPERSDSLKKKIQIHFADKKREKDYCKLVCHVAADATHRAVASISRISSGLGEGGGWEVLSIIK